jgi:TRAP-type C4-dicarboxylate transport system substrate-binding protein
MCVNLSAEKKQAEKGIKLSHVGSEEDARQKAALRFKEIVESETGGEIQVEAYYGEHLAVDLL